MSSVTEKLINNYKTYVQIPSILGGMIRSNGIVSSTWSQRNLEKGKSTKFMKEFFLKDLERVGDTVPLDISNEVLSRYSKSGTFRAVLREYENKTFLEVWHANHVLRTVDLGALDLHGPVYADELSSFEWSPDETKILYVAEKKATKSEPFYKRKPATEHNDGDGEGDKDKEEKSVGEEYVYMQDWGEQMVGKKESVIAEYHVDTDTVEIIKGIPKNVFVAQPTYSPDGSCIIGVAYELEPRKLGLIYCSNRPSTIFWIDAEGKYETLHLLEKSVKSPIFSPDGSSLLWFQRKSGGTHAACMSLVKAYLPLTKNSPVSTVIDVVDTELKIKSGQLFYGLYNNSFPKRPWASGTRLLLSTQQKYTVNSYVVNVENGDIYELDYPDGSLIVLDVTDDVVLAVHRNYLKMDKLVIGKLKDDNRIMWTDVTTSHIISSFDDCMYKYLDLTAREGARVNFNAIYVGPKNGAGKNVPLIVWPHGGPHSSFANYLALEVLMFLSAGYAVLLVNYRGSLGSGQQSVEFLPGKVGVADLKDCITATDTALSTFKWLNPDAVALVGGSHGGFIVLNLSGQYPDRFKAVVARNPVTDIASMSIISDIPDWCYVEMGEEYTQKGEANNKLFGIMHGISPISHAHKVKAPTLLQIGSKDLRVPPHQGTDYYLRLKANGVTAKMNLYEDNHPLSSVPNEMDNILNTILWIEKHVSS